MGGRVRRAVYTNDQVLFAGTYGSGPSNTATGVAIDSQGDLVISGQYVGAIDFGGGPLASFSNPTHFLVKIHPDGTQVWAKSFHDGNNTVLPGVGFSLAIDSADEIAAVGSANDAIDFGSGPVSGPDEDLVAMLVAANGTMRWSTRAALPGHQAATAVAFDANDDLHVVGTFEQTLDLGAGPLVSAGKIDAFVAKFHHAGGVARQAAFGAAGTDAFNGVVVDAQGHIAVVGTNGDQLDFGDGPIACHGPQPNCAITATLSASYQVLDHSVFRSVGDSFGHAIAAGGNGHVLGLFTAGLTDFGQGPAGTMFAATTLVSPP